MQIFYILVVSKLKYKHIDRKFCQLNQKFVKWSRLKILVSKIPRLFNSAPLSLPLAFSFQGILCIQLGYKNIQGHMGFSIKNYFSMQLACQKCSYLNVPLISAVNKKISKSIHFFIIH